MERGDNLGKILASLGQTASEPSELNAKCLFERFLCCCRSKRSRNNLANSGKFILARTISAAAESYVTEHILYLTENKHLALRIEFLRARTGLPIAIDMACRGTWLSQIVAEY